MAKHLIVHLKDQCISCGACAAISPDFWEMDEEGMANLKGSKKVGEQGELEIDSEEAKATNQEAADVCPVNIIKVVKK